MSEPDKAQANAAAAAAPRPMALGGQVYLIRPPTIRDNAALAAEVARYRARRSALSLLLADPGFKALPAALQVEAVKVATLEQVRSDGPPSFEDLLGGLMRPDCLAFAVWLLADPRPPLAEIRGAVTEDNAAEVMMNYLEASGMSSLGPEGNSAGRGGSTPAASTPPPSTSS